MALCLTALVTLPACAQEITVKLSNDQGQVSQRTIPELPPFEVSSAQCGWAKENRPLFPFQIDFTTTLDRHSFRPDQIRVEPPIPNLQIRMLGDIELSGHTVANTRYTVTLDPSLKDVYGRELGHTVSLPFEVGEAWPLLVMDSGIVGKPEIPVYTQGLANFRLRVYAGNPEEFASADQQPAGPVLLDRTVKVEGPGDGLRVTHLSLPSQPGYYLVDASGPDSTLLSYPGYRSCIQLTRLGVEVVGVGDSAHVWVTDLEDGHPVVGARVRRVGHPQIAQTDEQGTAILKAVDGGILLVEKGADRCLLNLYHLGRPRNVIEPIDKIFLNVRPRPGQPVQLRGWFKGRQEMAFQLEELAQGRLQPDRWGGISLDVPLPPTQAKTAELQLNGKKAEYFWLDQAEPGKSFVSGDEGLILNSDVGPEVHWEVTTTPVEFSPKGFDDFHFGVETRPTDRRRDFTTQVQGNPIRLRAQTLGLPSCWQAHCLARSGDVEKSSYYLIHPGNIYVGLKGDAYIESGEPLRWQSVTCDPAGQPVGGVSPPFIPPVADWWPRTAPPNFLSRQDPRSLYPCIRALEPTAWWKWSALIKSSPQPAPES